MIRRARDHADESLYDADALISSEDAPTIEDAVVPYDLTVVVVGAHRSPNKELPDLVDHAIAARVTALLPTWVVDQPSCPWRRGHLAYSTRVEATVADWPRVVLGDESAGADILPFPIAPLAKVRG